MDSRPALWRSTVFALAGLLLSALILTRHPVPDLTGRALAWLFAAAAAGLLFRALRRWIFLTPNASFHKSLSFSTLFQGSIQLHPQLAYPNVEQEFLTLHTGLDAAALSHWFAVRLTSVVAIPSALAAVVLWLAGQPGLAAGAALVSIGWTLLRLNGVPARVGRGRVFAAVMAGVAAAVAEGLLFSEAARVLYPGSQPWGAFGAYAAVLTAFELSPAPLALGVLELSLWAVLLAVPGDAVPGVWMAAGYRLARTLPMVVLALFYLPRYKMSAADLFNPNLARVLAGLRTPREESSLEPGAPRLTVVIPAYNEAQRLPRYLPDVVAFCEAMPGGAEVVVVDDGSKDETCAYVESVAALHPIVRLARQPRNMGKGEAVKRGVSEAAGRYVLFADADGATPIDQAPKLLAAAEAGADVAIGSRKIGGDAVRNRHWFRELMGSAFYRVTNLLVVPGVADTQCGFKLFRRDAARRIFPYLKERGWAFDVEVLSLAQKLAMTIDEVPVNWSEIEGSKLTPRDVWKMLVAIIRVRQRNAGLTRDVL